MTIQPMSIGFALALVVLVVVIVLGVIGHLPALLAILFAALALARMV